MRTLLGAALLLFALTLGWFSVANRAPYVPERLVTYRPIQAEEDGYVSSNACRACHPAQYEAWHASFHRTMTQVATPDTAIPNFNGDTVASVHGRPMVLSERDSRRRGGTF